MLAVFNPSMDRHGPILGNIITAGREESATSGFCPEQRRQQAELVVLLRYRLSTSTILERFAEENIDIVPQAS